MTAHDPILNSERPSIASGLLVQAATRRRIEFALMDIPLEDFAATIRAHLDRRFGSARADMIIRDMKGDRK